jgi:hypothetical protein
MSNDNEKILPSRILRPGGKSVTRRRAYVPPEPSLETLLDEKIAHAKWLMEFSVILSIDTGVQMTPFRQGQVTRLHWASRYIEHLERRVAELEEKLPKEEKQ